MAHIRRTTSYSYFWLTLILSHHAPIDAPTLALPQLQVCLLSPSLELPRVSATALSSLPTCLQCLPLVRPSPSTTLPTLPNPYMIHKLTDPLSQAPSSTKPLRTPSKYCPLQVVVQVQILSCPLFGSRTSLPPSHTASPIEAQEPP